MIPRPALLRSRVARIIVSLLLVTGCSDQPLPTGLTPDGPRLDVADASSSYKSGFYLLAPMVSQPSYGGTFDATLSPTVEICELASGACGAVIATYTTTDGPDGEFVRLQADEQSYQVNWHTNQFALSTTAFYRVSVRAGIDNTLLGYADVQPVSNGSGLKKIDTDEYIGLVDGRTLPIKFRIESGIVGRVEVEPAEATAEPTATQQFVAVLRDLHGNVMTDDVSWASSDAAVATVDQTGLATAFDDGSATITATSERISGTATLIVEQGGLFVLQVGRSHACAVALDGRAFCWGGNEQGQLGDGTLINRRTPIAVAGGLAFATISSGDFHTCGLTTTGQAYCWGVNQFGSLGDGSRVRRLTPVPVSGGHIFASIAAGGQNTCAITADNIAYCWGAGFFGANGNGSRVDALTPVTVSGGHAFASISANSQYACGVTTSGKGFCWGNGNSGRLGIGTNGIFLAPVEILGELTFTSISTGGAHACGITASGEGYCWGAGAFGRLGNGSLTTFLTPQRVAGGVVFAQISAGGAHSCGVAISGTGYCWGGPIDGSLGTGALLNQLTPAVVAGGHTWASIQASTTATAGSGSAFEFSCGVTVENQTYCWGSGFFGSLGNGSTNNRGFPTLVASFP